MVYPENPDSIGIIRGFRECRPKNVKCNSPLISVGCHTQGKTLEQVRKRIREAIELVLESDKDARKDKIQHPQFPSFLSIENVQISYA